MLLAGAGAVLKRDRVVIIVGLVAVTAVAWAYTIYLARDMMSTSIEMSAPHLQIWEPMDFVLTFAMWTVMQVAMMTPSAAPMILLFAKFGRQRRERQNPLLTTWTFLLGYLIVWAGFSAAATLVQWGLHVTSLLSPMMVSTSPVLGGILLVAAGVFQFTPLKNACLAHCRSPWGFLMSEWREGTRGALIMGLRHGAFCVGCCWLLMALMFVAGVMNLLWAAALTAYVLLEKLVPAGRLVSRAAGLLAIGWGVWMVAGTLL
jgi:predicted metal-binding membrane protein